MDPTRVSSEGIATQQMPHLQSNSCGNPIACSRISIKSRSKRFHDTHPAPSPRSCPSSLFITSLLVTNAYAFEDSIEQESDTCTQSLSERPTRTRSRDASARDLELDGPYPQSIDRCDMTTMQGITFYFSRPLRSSPRPLRHRICSPVLFSICSVPLNIYTHTSVLA